MNIPDQLDLLLHWARNTKRAQYAHYRMADKHRRRYRLIGIMVTAITVICGSSVIADWSKYFPSVDFYIKMAIGLTVLVASALSGIQTFLKLDERAQLHKNTGATYSAVKRHIDQLIVSVKTNAVDADILNNIREKIDALGADSPQVDDRVWKLVLQTMPALEFDHYKLDEYLPKQ